MSKRTTEQQLADHALTNAEPREIKKRLFEKGYRPRLLMKGVHDVVSWECREGGKGIAATHVWDATPLEALDDDLGCPWCRLEEEVNGDPEPVSEAELVKAIKAQHKLHADSLKRSKRKSSRSSNTYGLDKYAV